MCKKLANNKQTWNQPAVHQSPFEPHPEVQPEKFLSFKFYRNKLLRMTIELLKSLPFVEPNDYESHLSTKNYIFTWKNCLSSLRICNKPHTPPLGC